MKVYNYLGYILIGSVIASASSIQAASSKQVAVVQTSGDHPEICGHQSDKKLKLLSKLEVRN